MEGMLRPPKVFISAVTAELGEARDMMKAMFEQHGAEVVVQRSYHNSLSDGPAIQRAIEEADIVVCLVGHRYGAELPAGNRPPEAQPGCSWTQWELLYARKHAQELRLFFYDGPTVADAESNDFSIRQATFREQIETSEVGTFGGKFYLRFQSAEKLRSDVAAYVQNTDGALARFQAGTWAKIRSKYRSCVVDAWRSDYPNIYRGKRETPEAEKARLMLADHAPFIASQRFSILEPKEGKQAQALIPAAFLPGRSTETEALAREKSIWNPVPRDALTRLLLGGTRHPVELGGVEIPDPIRLFLVSGGGVGKTTNMRWLEAVLNGSDASAEQPTNGSVDEVARADRNPTGTPPSDQDFTATLAILVNAGTIVSMNDDDVLKELTTRIAATIGESKSTWSLDAIEEGLKRDAAARRLVILIDGLDHVESGKVPFLTSIQSVAPGQRWAPCTVIAAGRPHAVQGWKDGVGISGATVALNRWRFIEPSEFEPDEAEVFLGITKSISRHSLVADQLGGMARVPRVLEYVRTLPADRLIGVRTSADIYERSLRELVKRTLKAGGKSTRMIGPSWQEDCEREEPPGRQVRHVMKLLSVLAFLSLCPTTDPDCVVTTEAFKMSISLDVRKFIRARLAEEGEPPYDLASLERDFHAMAGFASILGNGVIDATDADAENFNSLVWSNRTIQQFLAAYWFSVHAGGFDVLAQRLAGKAVEVPAEDPMRDTERLRHYVFYPEDAHADTTYELNMFLAEMPPSAPLTPSSWVASASAWYDPDLHAGAGGSASTRKWSTEMLYRSWATMHDIAGYPFDDWWDLPYGLLGANPSGKARATVSVHRTRDNSGLNQNAAARRVARAVLDGFYSDFANILKGARGSEPQKTAQEMIEEQNWLAVPPGSFEMGSPLQRQGFPPKVKAYWNKDLDEVQTGQMPAEAVARRSTKKEWFTGAQGKLLREDDILWLTETFRLVEPEASTQRLDVPNRNAPAYQRALKILEDKWSRNDETPAENPQQVAAFVMHRLPVLHRWYYLFAPGHRDTVRWHLESTPHPPDDHPAIYISWFDAWAFCQWATWVVGDPDRENGQRRYGLRLPHEPEWEYAARWTPNAGGQPQPAQYGQRYWWGDDFYAHEDSPEPELLSNELAHAVGSPGHTRAPREAAPNGLGFRDILGNIWEWTANVYGTQREGDGTDRETMKYSRALPTERPPVNCLRTMRGGLWYYLDLLANCTARFRLTSDDRDYKMGFRVVREERSIR